MFYPEYCIDAHRLPWFIARTVLRDLIAGLRADDLIPANWTV
jgi:hypothetical protein